VKYAGCLGGTVAAYNKQEDQELRKPEKFSTKPTRGGEGGMLKDGSRKRNGRT